MGGASQIEPAARGADGGEEPASGSAPNGSAEGICVEQLAAILAAEQEGHPLAQVLEAGRRFSLVGHPLAHLEGEYAVVRVQHEGAHAGLGTARGEWGDALGGRAAGGAAAGYYRNRFVALPAAVSWCPPAPQRRRVLALLTATVEAETGDGADGVGRRLG